MKKTNTKTLTLYLLSFIGILVIALFLMNYYGILDDISDNVNWKVGERVSADGSNSVWLSEPFGELDMRVQIKEYDAGYENGMQFLKKHSEVQTAVFFINALIIFLSVNILKICSTIIFINRRTIL